MNPTFLELAQQIKDGRFEDESLDLSNIDLQVREMWRGSHLSRLQILLSVLYERDNTDIKDLILSGCNLTAADTTELALVIRALSALEELILDRMDIAELCARGNTTFLEALRAKDSLTRLFITEAALTPEVAQIIFTYVQLPRITELILSRNPLGQAGLVAVFSQRPDSLEVLELAECGLTAASMPFLRLLLTHFPLCQDLVLDENPLGDMGLMELLNGPNSLKSLTCSKCEITDAGIIAIGDALARGFLPELISLLIMDNRFSAAGLMIESRGLFPGIIAQAKLESLRLDDNRLSDQAVPSLTYLIKSNSQVDTLTLINTGLTDHGARAIGAALQERREVILTTLRTTLMHLGEGQIQMPKIVEHIYLDGNQISPEMLDWLKTTFADTFFSAADAVSSDDESEYSGDMQDVEEALEGLALAPPPSPSTPRLS